MFVLVLDLVEDFHTVEERRLHRIFCGLADYITDHYPAAQMTWATACAADRHII